jgi:hypothetical protein
VAIMCASAPALKPLYIRYIMPRVGSRTRGSHYNNDAYSTMSMNYQSRGSKKASNKLSTVEMGIVVSREISQVVIVEKEKKGNDDCRRSLGLQPKVHELWRKNSEESSLKSGIPVQLLQSV